MSQQFKPLLTMRMVMGSLPMALAALAMPSCTTPARDHYMNLMHCVVEVGAPEHDEVALAFGLPLYQPPTDHETEAVLVEVPSTDQP